MAPGRPPSPHLAAGTVAGIYAFNGYGAAIFFGEDMRDGRRDLAPVVLQALAVGVILVMPPIAWVAMAAPGPARSVPRPRADLRLHLATRRPWIGAGHELRRRVGDLQYHDRHRADGGAAAVRDGARRPLAGPDQQRALAVTHGRLGSPWTATATMGCCGLVCCLLDPHVLVLVLGNSNVVTYAGLCIAALQWRRARPRPRTPGGGCPGSPRLPSLLLCSFLIVAVLSLFTSAGRIGMLATAATFGAGLGLRSWAEHGRHRDRDT